MQIFGFEYLAVRDELVEPNLGIRFKSLGFPGYGREAFHLVVGVTDLLNRIILSHS